MDLKSNRDYMITNRNLNTMFKPNNMPGKFTTSSGVNNDAGVNVLNGKFNHHTAIVFDIIYDQIYRIFNQIEGVDYIASSLTRLLSANDGKRKNYFTKFLTDRKLDFLLKVGKLLVTSKSVESIPFNNSMRDFLLNTAPDIIDNAFPLEFSLQYRSLLESKCEQNGNFDKVINLFKTYNLEKHFFIYLLNNIFYGKLPSWDESTFPMKIKLDSIFDNDERSIYILKNWFKQSTNLKFSMTYPVTCFSHHFDESKYMPKKLTLQTYMDSLPGVTPIPQILYDKSNMSIEISLANKFMAYFAHDAKLCVRTYVPSSLYKLNNNAFFIGKNILNNNFYNKTDGYQNRKYYKIDELFNFLNLPVKDGNNNCNNSHRRKTILKSLDQLDSCSIIKINKLNSQRVELSDVWNITSRQEEDYSRDCIEQEI